jgi:hypothetical protein
VINGETANAALVSGEVTVKLPGNRTEIALTGVSRIRQAHAQKELTRVVQIPVELSLVSAAGAESGRARGGKGVVRTLTAPARRVPRERRGEPRGRPQRGLDDDRPLRRALTRVTKGRTRVSKRRGRRGIAVHAGHRYSMKARSFRARKGR